MLVSQFIAQSISSAQVLLCTGDEEIGIRGQAEPEQVAGAMAVGGTETGNACLRMLVRPASPGTFKPLRVFDHQRAQQTGRGQQVVDVPVLTFAARRVALQPRCQPARSKRAAGVTVQTGFEAYPTRPADLQVSMLRQRQQQHVGAGAERNHWSPARLATILSMRRWRVSAALAVSTWRTCSLRLLCANRSNASARSSLSQRRRQIVRNLHGARLAVQFEGNFHFVAGLHAGGCAMFRSLTAA